MITRQFLYFNTSIWNRNKSEKNSSSNIRYSEEPTNQQQKKRNELKHTNGESTTIVKKQTKKDELRTNIEPNRR